MQHVRRRRPVHAVPQQITRDVAELERNAFGTDRSLISITQKKQHLTNASRKFIPLYRAPKKSYSNIGGSIFQPGQFPLRLVKPSYQALPLHFTRQIRNGRIKKLSGKSKDIKWEENLRKSLDANRPFRFPFIFNKNYRIVVSITISKNPKQCKTSPIRLIKKSIN